MRANARVGSRLDVGARGMQTRNGGRRGLPPSPAVPPGGIDCGIGVRESAAFQREISGRPFRNIKESQRFLAFAPIASLTPWQHLSLPKSSATVRQIVIRFRIRISEWRTCWKLWNARIAQRD